MRSVEIRKPLSRMKAPVSEGIAIRCRVRLARNLEGERFPDWASEEDRKRILERVGAVLQGGSDAVRVAGVAPLSEQERDMLCERHLASPDLMRRESGGGLAYREDGSACVMINEEDHLRIQGFADGADLQQAWQVAEGVDRRLEAELDYAWKPGYGFLTACPSNVGTGLRASMMLHLLGLRLLDEVEAVIRGLERLRLLVRGVFGEGSEGAGQIFQISNMDTMGYSEGETVARVERICGEVIRQEHQARARLASERSLVLLDCLARSLSILQSARLMSTAEALEYLAALRLGAAMGLITRLKVAEVDQLILQMQPGHLQQSAGVDLSSEERDKMRALFLRRKVATLRLKG